ncbi:hypothetical protein [Streptomyces fragilis]|uniref:DUF3558 domain-containing protein n=1 Tax=Streptomyces fragilis TaxID=67301 RepID=A0ABV2YCE6_9ACTN|nr:hypothetical protein [Streptomyces fragilis]
MPFPLPLALTVRLMPVVVLASAGWAMSVGPLADPPEAAASGQESTSSGSSADSGDAGDSGDSGEASGKDDEEPGKKTDEAGKTHTKAPDPCKAVSKKTVTSLVPGKLTTGELASTDKDVRRMCQWHALKGYDYRWLDVSFEIRRSTEDAQKAFDRVAEGKGGPFKGLGDEAYSLSAVTSDKGNKVQETELTVRSGNAIVVVTYNGGDFVEKTTPSADKIRDGAAKAAGEALAALEKPAG